MFPTFILDIKSIIDILMLEDSIDQPESSYHTKFKIRIEKCFDSELNFQVDYKKKSNWKN